MAKDHAEIQETSASEPPMRCRKQVTVTSKLEGLHYSRISPGKNLLTAWVLSGIKVAYSIFNASRSRTATPSSLKREDSIINFSLRSKTRLFLIRREKALGTQKKKREGLKKLVEKIGLICDCGEKVFEITKGSVEEQPNYNKYFEYLQCPRCKKIYYL